MLPRALLLDFDGVIVDSENYHTAAWQRTLLAMGRDAPDSLCSRAAEIDDRAFLQEIFGGGIAKVDIEGWLRRKEEITAQMFADIPRLYEGVRELIPRLVEKGVRVGIVSTTKRENIETVLASTGLGDSISLIVAKQDVKTFKPVPEGYRLAVERLGIKAEDAVAIEDSETGYHAAKAAGLKTIIVGHRRPSGPWLGDSLYLPHFRRLDEVIAAIERDSREQGGHRPLYET